MNRAVMMIIFVLPLALGAVACNQEQQTATPVAETTATAAPQSLTPSQLGEVGAEVRKNPDDADEILAKRGMTMQSFEQSVREVAENPEAAREYAAAFRRASA